MALPPPPLSPSCGPGRQLVGRTCQDVDECAWRPCLHGGSCQNLRPGFLCVCGPGHAGDYCQWTKVDSAAYPLTGPMAIVALTLSVIFVGESRAGNWDNPLGFFALSCKLVFILYLNTFFFSISITTVGYIC